MTGADIWGQGKQAAEHGGYPMAVGDPVLCDGFKRRYSLELAHDHATPATLQHADIEAAGGMVERRYRQKNRAVIKL